jgi:hypothetical protein
VFIAVCILVGALFLLGLWFVVKAARADDGKK